MGVGVAAARVFLSYTEGDQEPGFALAAELERLGLDVWHMTGRRSGEEYSVEIDRRLDAADAYVLLHSARTATSKGCLREVEGADKRHLLVVPVRLDAAAYSSGFGYFLNALPFIRWTGAAATARAVAARLSAARDGGEVPSGRRRSGLRWQSGWSAVGVGVAVVLALAVAVAAVLWGRQERPAGQDQPTSDAITSDSYPRLDGTDLCPGQADDSLVAEVRVDLFVRIRHAGSCWTRSLVGGASPSEAQIELHYKNTSSVTQTDVAVTLQLAKGLTYLPASTFLATDRCPQGCPIDTAALVDGRGVSIGSYLPGAGAWVTVLVRTPERGDLTCGDNLFRSIGTVQPKNVTYVWNTVDIRFTRTC